LLILPEPIGRKVCLTHQAWFNHGTQTKSGFIHVWQFVVTHYRKVVSDTQNEASPFDCKITYSLCSYWGLLLSIRQSLKFRFRIKMMLPGALTGRLSCGHSETSQTNRQQCEPRRSSTQRAF
jgi:hypothetical protein